MGSIEYWYVIKVGGDVVRFPCLLGHSGYPLEGQPSFENPQLLPYEAHRTRILGHPRTSIQIRG